MSSKSKNRAKSPKGKGKVAIPTDELFKRDLHENIFPMHNCEYQHVSIYLFQREICEVWYTTPHVLQFSNSNSAKKKTPKSPGSSGKGTPAQQADQFQEFKFDPGILYGLAVADKTLISEGYSLFVNVTAWLFYAEDPSLPPYRENIRTSYQAFNKTIEVYPTEWMYPESYWTEHELRIIRNIKHISGPDSVIEKFRIDLTGLPDSITFQRPGIDNNHDGVFWKVKAFVAKQAYDYPYNGEEAMINIKKYTFMKIEQINNPSPRVVDRFSGPLDDGSTIKLTVTLDKEIYYQEDEIKASIHVENDSNRTMVHNITVSVEQCVRFFSQMPQDYSSVIGRQLIGPGQNGLPINPKTKTYNYTSTLKLYPNPRLYNLILANKTKNLENRKLACSSFIMFRGEIEEEQDAKKDGDGGGKSNSSPSRGRNKNKSNSAKDKSPKGGSGKSPGKEKSPGKDKSPGKNQKHSKDSVIKQNEDTEQKKSMRKRIHLLTNRQRCRPVFISYDVVVRMDLKSQNKEWVGGTPSVRVPFLLAAKKPEVISEIPQEPPNSKSSKSPKKQKSK